MNLNKQISMWLKLSLIWALLTNMGVVFAHDDDFTQVEIKLEIPAIDQQITTINGEQINLHQAYLTSFSFELIACAQINLKPQSDEQLSLFSWFMPKAYANHGVSFTKPTQIPVMKRHNLLINNDINLGIYKLPKGKYCQMNYTLGKVPGTQTLSPEIKSSSLFITGRKADTNSNSVNLIAKSDYAFGKNFPIDLEVPASHKALSLVISVNVSEAIQTLEYATPDHKNARRVMLTLPNNVMLKWL